MADIHITKNMQIKKVYEARPGHSLFVCTKSYLKSTTSLAGFGVILLDNTKKILPGVETHKYVLPDEELIDGELLPVAQKLAEINTAISIMLEHNNVLVVCRDGRNKSLLVAGYFIKANGGKAAAIIQTLEQIYWTPEQVRQEDEYNDWLADPDDSVAAEMTRGYCERLKTRGLTRASFRNILRRM